MQAAQTDGWLQDHLTEHAVALRRPLMKMKVGRYTGMTPCCEVLWRAVRTPDALTIRYIHIDLPGGQLLFGW